MKTYGKPFEKDGVVWYHTIPWYLRSIYRIVKAIQWSLWKIGINWHDFLFNECTPDFNCCIGKQIL